MNRKNVIEKIYNALMKQGTVTTKPDVLGSDPIEEKIYTKRLSINKPIGKGPNTIYIKYDPIGISKKARVVYSLLKCPYLKKYMNKYGYQENEEKGWHWNAVTFANVYAGLYLDELHTDLKTDGRWTYDDDYDW